MYNTYDMVNTVYSVVGNGLENVEELLFQGEEVVVVWLANNGRLGVESISWRSFTMSDEEHTPFSLVSIAGQRAQR